MNKFQILIILLLLPAASLLAQVDTAQPRDPWKNTRDGNDLYKKKDYAGAEKKYREAVKTDTSKSTANYNLGNSLYKQKKYDEAERAYADGLNSENKDTLAKGWYNLGNSLLEQGKLEESVTAYKEALKNNPNDENARYNLALTQKLIKVRKEKEKEEEMKGLKKDPKGKYRMEDSAGDKKMQKNKDGKDGKKDSGKPVDAAKQNMSPEEAKKVLSVMKDTEQKTRQRINQSGNGSPYRRSKDKDW